MYHSVHQYYLPRLLAVMTSLICMLPMVSVQAAIYNSASGELFLPSLIDGSKTLIDVVIKLKPDGSYILQKGTESKLPFQCPGVFSKATLDLVKSSTSANKIDTLLGCRWSSQRKASIGATQNFPASTGLTTTWIDSTCAPLVVSISDFSGSPKVQSSAITQNNAGCNMSLGFANFYDLNSKAFLISSVVIDNSIVATEVVIKFTDKNHYELINFSLTPRASPPVVCSTLTDAAFKAISTDMTPAEINSLLNCQWQNKLISENSLSSSRSKNYSWVDHECNEILITDGQDTIIFSQHKTAGCRSFSAR